MSDLDCGDCDCGDCGCCEGEDCCCGEDSCCGGEQGCCGICFCGENGCGGEHQGCCICHCPFFCPASDMPDQVNMATMMAVVIPAWRGYIATVAVTTNLQAVDDMMSLMLCLHRIAPHRVKNRQVTPHVTANARPPQLTDPGNLAGRHGASATDTLALNRQPCLHEEANGHHLELTACGTPPDVVNIQPSPSSEDHGI